MLTFREYIAEAETKLQKLHSEVGNFLRSNPHYHKATHDCEAAKGACDSASKALAAHLNTKGIKAHVQAAQGFRPELPADAHPDWQNFKGRDQKYLWHAVVRAGHHVVDTTGAQYGKKYAGARIMPHSEFKKDWTKIKPFR